MTGIYETQIKSLSISIVQYISDEQMGDPLVQCYQAAMRPFTSVVVVVVSGMQLTIA